MWQVGLQEKISEILLKKFDLGSADNKLALVLATSHPVTWHLSVAGFSSPPDILVSDGSNVVDIQTGHQVMTSTAIMTTPNLTTKLARPKFSHINTFTTIDTANRIFINLPPGKK